MCFSYFIKKTSKCIFLVIVFSLPVWIEVNILILSVSEFMEYFPSAT